MNRILENATVDRRVPDWRAVQLASRVPIKILRAARDYHVNTSDEIYFQMLDHIGIDAICDIVSQGCFLYDISTTLDIPVTKLRDWLDSNSKYIEMIESAEELSAEAYLSASTDVIMGVASNDTDSARVAKIKADHLKWLASRKDREKYADRVNHNHTGGQMIEYRISMSTTPAQPNRIIDVDQLDL